VGTRAKCSNPGYCQGQGRRGTCRGKGHPERETCQYRSPYKPTGPMQQIYVSGEDLGDVPLDDLPLHCPLEIILEMIAGRPR